MKKISKFFAIFVSHFCPPGSGSGFWIYWPDWIRIQYGSGSVSETLAQTVSMCVWQVNDDGLSSLLDVAELLGVRGLKSDRRPETSKARKPHASTSFCMFLPVLWIWIRSRIRNKSFRIHNFGFYKKLKHFVNDHRNLTFIWNQILVFFQLVLMYYF